MMYNDVALPVETKPCAQCSKRMVPRWTDIVYTSMPPYHEWEWWCRCGHRETGGQVLEMLADDGSRKRWELVNDID